MLVSFAAHLFKYNDEQEPSLMIIFLLLSILHAHGEMGIGNKLLVSPVLDANEILREVLSGLHIPAVG